MASDFVGGDDALGDQPLRVERARGRGACAICAVHQRLGEGRLVGLVVAVAAVADDVEHDVALEAACGTRAAMLGARSTTASGSSPLTWKIGAWIDLRDVGAVEPGAGVRRDGGEADLVVDDEVDRAAGAVADQLAHRQRLVRPGPGRRRRRRRASGCAMTECAAAGCRRRTSCRARTLPTTTGSTASRCEGLGCSDRCTVWPAISTSVEVPRWYFTSPEPCTSSGLKLSPPNSREHRGERLLHHVHQRVEPAAMRHADGDLVARRRRRRSR